MSTTKNFVTESTARLSRNQKNRTTESTDITEKEKFRFDKARA